PPERFPLSLHDALPICRRRFHLLHWPQPGLEPRDPARGDRLERVAYKGFVANLHPELASGEFARALAARGLAWDADAVDFAAGRDRKSTRLNSSHVKIS